MNHSLWDKISDPSILAIFIMLVISSVGGYLSLRLRRQMSRSDTQIQILAGYSELVTSLQSQITTMRREHAEEIAELRRENEECNKRVTVLREEIKVLRRALRGAG
jgi:cell division protein FtsB